MFFIDILRAINAILAIQNATYSQIVAGGRQAAGQMELYAKQHAPWQDRTGNARRTLEGFCVDQEDTISVGVCGNMPYSPRLETGFQGRYAILVPTMEYHSIYIIDMIRNAVVTAAAANRGGGVSVE